MTAIKITLSIESSEIARLLKAIAEASGEPIKLEMAAPLSSPATTVTDAPLGATVTPEGTVIPVPAYGGVPPATCVCGKKLRLRPKGHFYQWPAGHKPEAAVCIDPACKMFHVWQGKTEPLASVKRFLRAADAPMPVAVPVPAPVENVAPVVTEAPAIDHALLKDRLPPIEEIVAATPSPVPAQMDLPVEEPAKVAEPLVDVPVPVPAKKAWSPYFKKAENIIAKSIIAKTNDFTKASIGVAISMVQKKDGDEAANELIARYGLTEKFGISPLNAPASEPPAA